MASQPVPNYDLADTDKSYWEDDNYPEDFSDADSGSYNGAFSTESDDGTCSVISASRGQLSVVCTPDIRLTKENQISQLSYFNHSQQNIRAEPTSFTGTAQQVVSEPRPPLSYARLTVPASSIQTVANSVAEVSGGFDIWREVSEYKGYPKLSNTGHTSPDESSQSVPNYDLVDTDKSYGEDDNYPEDFSDADSGSYNGPPSLKLVCYSQLICISHTTKTRLT